MMTAMVCTKAVKDEIADLHDGLHQAMDHLINRRDYAEAERIIRLIDARMSNLINQARVAKLP